MSCMREPKSGEAAWTWATVEGPGPVDPPPPAVELVCDCAFEAADASPALVAIGDGALGPPDGLEMVA